MVRIEVPRELIKRHTDAVMARIRNNFDEAKLLESVQSVGASEIEDFITADVEQLREWVRDCTDKLQFKEFADIYKRYFSNGERNYVADDYNAYAFLEMLGIEVCPYCDDEYIDIVDVDGKKKRTSELDHFFAKGKYPALAMCIYNLVPSGQICNGEKREYEIGANPYEADIESWTFLYPDIPVGANMELVEEDRCRPLFHEKKGMVSNVKRLLLEKRYERHAGEVKKLLGNLQFYSDEKMNELVKMGAITNKEQFISSMFGPQDPKEKKRALRQKMLHDLTGY